MTCAGCQATVKHKLLNVEGVKSVGIDLAKGDAVIEMEKHIPIHQFQLALKDYPKYRLSENGHHHFPAQNNNEETKNWIQTYKPILLIFAYIVGVTLLIEMANGEFLWIRWMDHFMGGFFLAFSFFKLLDLHGFADSYSGYDIIAKKWKGWSYLYVFMELGLGLAFITGFKPLLTNGITFVIMSVSLVGVLQSVMQKKTIKCACLGAVFDLPMSTVTIVEYVIMIVMSFASLISMIYL